MVAGMRERLDERGDDRAIADEFGQWTLHEFNRRVNQLIHGFRGLGLGVGDTMCVVGNNRHEWPEAFAAGSNTGLVVVPVNWHFSADEIAYVLENSGATVVVGDTEFAEAVGEAVRTAGTRVRIAFGGPIDGFTDIEEVIAAGSPDEPTDQVSGKSMLYTSGTSGRPKGVQSTLQQVGGDPVENLEKLKLLLSLYRLPSSRARSCCATRRCITADRWRSAAFRSSSAPRSSFAGNGMGRRHCVSSTSTT